MFHKKKFKIARFEDLDNLASKKGIIDNKLDSLKNFE